MIRIALVAIAAVAVLLVAVAVMAGVDDGANAAVGDEPVAPGRPLALLLVDGEDAFAAPTAEHTRTALRRAKVPFAEHDLSRDGPLPPLDSFGAVLSATERLRLLSDDGARQLGAFVQEGGGLGVLYRAWDPRLAALLGLATSGPPSFALGPRETTLTTPMMPGGENLTVGTLEAAPLDVDAAPDCDVLMTWGDDRPAAWTCARGRGRVAFWNSTLLGTKPFRGHLLQTLALVQPRHVRPLAGWAVVYLDDFPSPASNAELDPIWTELGQTPAEFYAQTWYPDMVAVAEEAGLTYTSTVIYSYNGQTEAPFTFEEWAEGQIEDGWSKTLYSPWVMAEDARRSEVALHGYNHQSLTLELWPDRARMVEALRAARQRWEAEGLAPLPVTYVPPMNWIDSVGVSALREAFPEIETIAGLYFGPEERGQNREFGPEPWAPELYALPRGTAGFIMNDGARLRTLTLLHSVGVWSHFVHPDEVYPNADRAETYSANGLPDPTAVGWRRPGGMLDEFREWVRFVQLRYPWLESVPAREATVRMRAFDRLSLAYEGEATDEGRRLDVRLSQPGQTLMTWARPGETLEEVRGGTVLDVWDGPLFTQYVVRSEGRRLTLRYADAPPPSP